MQMKKTCKVKQELNFSDVLLRWYQENRRILPWREDPTPYHVWISEIMLQQTRVEAVKSYYARFLAELPDIASLAASEEDHYLKLWEGLGYYSRVRNLHRAAGQLMAEHQGRMPDTAEQLLRIAGIGPYTAAAVASMSFGERIPAIDGNLLRCFSRLSAYSGSLRDRSGRQAAYRFFLDRMPPESRGGMPRRDEDGILQDALWNPCGAFNQAMMDLGAMICLPNGQPKCGACPLAVFCIAHRLGQEGDFPVREEKKPRRVEKRTVFLLRRGEEIALRKRPARGLLAGLYELPNTEGTLTETEALQYLSRLGIAPLRLRQLPPARHIFTHKEWDMSGYEVFIDELAPLGAPGKGEVRCEDSAAWADRKEQSQAIALNRSKPPVSPAQRSGAEETAGGIFFAPRAAIRERYPVPSAFSAYTVLF